MPIHAVRFQQLTTAPTITALCAGYEDNAWRSSQLVDDVFQRHLPSFALSFTDWESINGETAAKLLKKAALAVYSTDKYRRRGEFGELLLHAAAKDFFGANPAVSKIHFKDSPNDTVKGFDCVHVIERDGDLEVWLGEVKFYQDLGDAISDSAKELAEHLDKNFLKREFVAITNKLDPNWPHTPAVRKLLDDSTSLDQIVDRLVIPVLLTYDSKAVVDHQSLSAEYIAAVEAEATAALSVFNGKLSMPYPVTIHLILAPLESKSKLVGLFHQKLKVWQHL